VEERRDTGGGKSFVKQISIRASKNNRKALKNLKISRKVKKMF